MKVSNVMKTNICKVLFVRRCVYLLKSKKSGIEEVHLGGPAIPVLFFLEENFFPLPSHRVPDTWGGTTARFRY